MDGESKRPEPLHLNIKRFAILCAFIFTVGAAIGGLISSKISYKISYNKGTENGILIAKSTYEPQIGVLSVQHQTEIEQTKREVHDAGFEEALSEMATPSITLTLSPTPESSTEPESSTDASSPAMILREETLSEVTTPSNTSAPSPTPESLIDASESTNN